ncbi:MAG: hypothetical protein Q7S73_02650 [bacterium]|nr:hypothetical protein [bacterium]
MESENFGIQKFLEDLSGKLKNETKKDSLIDLDDPIVVLWRKRELEMQARKQGYIARCPSPGCCYIVPLTMMTGEAESGKRFCTICEKEFDYDEAEKEAKKYLRYETLINYELQVAGFNGRIGNLKKDSREGLLFGYNREFIEEIKNRNERFKSIFKEIIPEEDRKI